MNVLNSILTLGTATLGFALAYYLGTLAFARKRRAELIRERLEWSPRVHSAYLAYASPRFRET